MSNTHDESLLHSLAESFRMSWLALSSLPGEAITDPDHPAWREAIENAKPHFSQFGHLTKQVRMAFALDHDSACKIEAAEILLRELINRLHQRDRRRLPALLTMACLRACDELRALATITPPPASTAAAVVPDLVLAEAAPAATKPRKPSTRTRTPRNSATPKIISALLEHHGYSKGRTGTFASVPECAPIPGKMLAELAGVSEASVTRFFVDHFADGRIGYERGCRSGTLATQLALLAGDITPRRLVEFSANVSGRYETE